jgi:hypothetical protein
MPELNQSQPQFEPSLASESVPQFSTAEYASTPSAEHCRICSKPITGEYYRVNGQIACEACGRQASEGQPTDSHAAFARALLLGSGGAVLGLILYSAVAILTGWTIGYLALAVGWLVGKGIQKGSNGLGGRRYQIAAVALTYAAISISAIPIGISYALHHRPAAVNKTASENPFPEDNQLRQPVAAPKREIHIGPLIGQLLFMGLASPFLAFTGNVGSAAIGLFILFIGLRIAWTMTKARTLDVDGPYGVSTA